MKTLLVWSWALACAYADISVLPECLNTGCASRDFGRDIEDGWFSKDYLVDGKRMSVATRNNTIRWMCYGSDPTRSSAPRYPYTSHPPSATAVELIDCDITSTSYQLLLNELTVTFGDISDLTISNPSQNIPWPSMEKLQYLENMYKKDNGEWVAYTATYYPTNLLKHLSIRGTPMNTEQLLSIYKIRTLTLVDTGLTTMVNLSEFSKLYRLELHEPMLENATMLRTAPALEELVLRAPDAGLAPMPRLRNATFLDVYAMGSIFGDCKKLENLAIKSGDLDRIHEHWLAGCTSLLTLKLTRLPNLRCLPDDLLADTANLRVLDLSRNGLESLPDGLFSNVEKLVALNLRHNSLKALPKNLILKPSLKFLKYVCVSHNGRALNKQINNLPIRPRWSYHDNCDDAIQLY